MLDSKALLPIFFVRIVEIAKEFLGRQQSVMNFLMLFPCIYRMIGFCVVLGFILS